MAVDRGRDTNVVDAAVRESGRGFPPPGRVRRGWGENGSIPGSHGRNPMAVDCDYGKSNNAVGVFGDLYY